MENPLVSIIVVTYNSEKYVLETLESAKAQTYRNIELIITDDCSTDHTVEICRNWLIENKHHFGNAVIITAEKNTGIAPNCNRGLYASKGQWINFIAGDDMLYKNRIQECIKTVRENSSIKILFSNVAINGNLSAKTQTQEPFFSMLPQKQYRELLKGNFLPAPALFINRETILQLNGFNEKYALFEDFPFFLKALRHDIKLYKIDQQLVYYRIGQDNISRKKRMNFNYQMCVKRFFKDEFLKELWHHRLYVFFAHYFTEYLLLQLVSLNIIKFRSTYDFFLRWFSILRWVNRVKKVKYLFATSDE
ncbi:MAG TPA: glycosyltransferase [Prolixibacteraceae bacterium]|nr:glycosyltransferase [Prolixibacteraceae bacterium]